MRKIGGWTRIWIALTAIFFAVGYLSASADCRKAIFNADSEYKRLADRSTWGAQHPEEVAKARSDCELDRAKSPKDVLTELICGYAESLTPNLTIAAAGRDKKKAAAFSKAWSDALSMSGIVTTVIGILFFAVGWIRNGFPEKQVPHSPVS